MNRFDEIKIGQTAEIKRTITAEDIRKFVDLTGDDNRLHTDAGFAARTSFKKPVAHGMLGASFISTIIGTKLPGDGALWFAQNLEFTLPVRVGDTLTIRAEVIKKDDRSRVIELRTDITNQLRQKVTQGVAKVKVIEQEPESIVEPANQHHKKVALVVGGSGGIGAAVCQRWLLTVSMLLFTISRTLVLPVPWQRKLKEGVVKPAVWVATSQISRQ